MSQAAVPDWWQSLYDDIVAEVFLVRKDREELAATVAFLRDRLDLSAGHRVLDQCCGIGSLSLPLGQLGLAVLGVDQCPAYIDRARREAGGASCIYHVADAISFRADSPVDAVVNWGTSFGNADDARNLQMLACAFASLRPGGRLALDYQHVPRVLRSFQPAMTYHHQDDRGETVLLRESAADLAAGLLRQRWTFFYPDGQRRVQETAVRLYLPHELAALVHRAGFFVEGFHGGVRGEALTLDSPRCILIARRPT